MSYFSALIFRKISSKYWLKDWEWWNTTDLISWSLFSSIEASGDVPLLQRLRVESKVPHFTPFPTRPSSFLLMALILQWNWKIWNNFPFWWNKSLKKLNMSDKPKRTFFVRRTAHPNDSLLLPRTELYLWVETRENSASGQQVNFYKQNICSQSALKLA